MKRRTRWMDATKLNEAIESLEYDTAEKATYLKITLRKLILFMTSAAYQEYLSQHSRFVFLNGNRDRYTDSWVTIEGKMLPIEFISRKMDSLLTASCFFSGWTHPKDLGGSHCSRFSSRSSHLDLLVLHFAGTYSSLSCLVLQKLRQF